MLPPALKDKADADTVKPWSKKPKRARAAGAMTERLILSSSVASRTNFTSSRCLLGREFREGMNDEFAAVITIWKWDDSVCVSERAPADSVIHSARSRARSFVEMISKITGKPGDASSGGRRLPANADDAEVPDGRSLTEDEITGLLFAGMFAGHHNVRSQTAWAMIDLLQSVSLKARH